MASITVTADTDLDPYSAFWSDLTSADIEVVDQYLSDLDGWTLSPDFPTVLRVEPLLVHLDHGERTQRVYLAATASDLVAAADAIERLLRRGPDSIT